MEVKVVAGQNNFEHLIYIGNHVLISDAGVDSGGQDKGPAPHDILSASLAACTAITLKMYANLKKLPLKNTEVYVDQVQENDTTVFIRKIKLEGELTPENVKRLLEIADRCPVHKILMGKIQVRTSPVL